MEKPSAHSDADGPAERTGRSVAEPGGTKERLLSEAKIAKGRVCLVLSSTGSKRGAGRRFFPLLVQPDIVNWLAAICANHTISYRSLHSSLTRSSNNRLPRSLRNKWRAKLTFDTVAVPWKMATAFTLETADVLRPPLLSPEPIQQWADWVGGADLRRRWPDRL